uniref:Uncharacterized protein n=1 Tax=Physcomitrium patens TaxID=3218 RepID=A0A2K1IYE5_PHYPA|nr:hypothetical protein PHYPA_024112 [Physcomitrium patens]
MFEGGLFNLRTSATWSGFRENQLCVMFWHRPNLGTLLWSFAVVSPDVPTTGKLIHLPAPTFRNFCSTAFSFSAPKTATKPLSTLQSLI